MKINRKFIRNKESSVSSLAIFIITGVALLLAVVAWAYFTGVISVAPQKPIPSVGMIQASEGDYILITAVKNGPVINSSVTIQILNLTNGSSEGTGIINTGLDGEVNAGDTIVLTDISRGIKYKVLVLYEGNIVGNCKYILI